MCSEGCERADGIVAAAAQSLRRRCLRAKPSRRKEKKSKLRRRDNPRRRPSQNGFPAPWLTRSLAKVVNVTQTRIRRAWEKTKGEEKEVEKGQDVWFMEFDGAYRWQTNSEETSRWQRANLKVGAIWGWIDTESPGAVLDFAQSDRRFSTLLFDFLTAEARCASRWSTKMTAKSLKRQRRMRKAGCRTHQRVALKSWRVYTYVGILRNAVLFLCSSSFHPHSSIFLN